MALFPPTAAPAVKAAALVLPLPLILLGGGTAWWLWRRGASAPRGTPAVPAGASFAERAQEHMREAVRHATESARLTDQRREVPAAEAAREAFPHVKALRELLTGAPPAVRSVVATALTRAERAYRAAVTKWKVIFRGARLGALDGPRGRFRPPRPPRSRAPRGAPAADVEAPETPEAPEEPEEEPPGTDGFWQ